ncbi:MAG: FlgD immunoglobulin-like domain containing protein [Candidatus Zixiibacteriota bacterium]
MKKYLIVLLILLTGFIWATTRYNAVAEWNGPYFRITNAPDKDQKVDSPVIGTPFSSPVAVTGRLSNGNPQIYVADQDNDRIQAFEVPVEYEVIDATSPWLFTGAAPSAAYEINHDALALAKFDSDDILYRIVKGSVILKVDGEVWTEVQALGDYSASDKVYYINYQETAGNPYVIINTPANSFTDSNGDTEPEQTIEVYYAYAHNSNLAIDGGGNELSYGYGDIDYGITTAGSDFVKLQIDETTPGGISDIQSLSSIFAIENLSISVNTELFILDMDDNSSNEDEYLFMYNISDLGVVDATPNPIGTNEKYDGILSYPRDVFVADKGGHIAVDGSATLHDITDITAVTVTDANQITGHIYEIDLVAADNWTITDLVTGEKIVSGGDYPEAAGSPYTGIPGLSLTTANFTTAETGSLVTVNPDYGRYIFITDTDNDRIKILAMADVADPDFAGDWLDGDFRDADADADIDTDFQKTTPSNPNDARNWGFYTATYPIKEGSLDTIKIGRHRWRIDPDNNLENNDSDDSLYTVDYMNGYVDFGDGTNGARVPLNKTVTYSYTTSVDVIRYGSTGSGSGQFHAPSGIAARWNSQLDQFDVYVSDAGNSRVQKFAFYPGGDVSPPSMSYITEWNTASTSHDLLGMPGGIHVVEETGSTLDTVWIFLCDVTNNRVISYIDGAVRNGSNSPPTFDRIIGLHGNQLGSFMRPVGITALPNGSNSFDIYVADEERNQVQKFQAAHPVTVDISETGISLLPKSFSPGGTYTITYTITGAFECGYVNFYYSEDTLFDSSDKLCNPENTINAKSGQDETWDWKFSSSPDGLPDNGSYYLFAKIVTCDDIEELATDRTTNTITINSDLMIKLSLRDFFDEDAYMLLQNGAEKAINLTLDYPVGVSSIEVNGTYPSDMFRIEGINRGNIFDLEGEATNVIFQADWDSAAGTWSIDMSQTGDPDGCNVSPSGDVAIIRIKASDDMISPDAPIVVDTFTMDTDSSQVIKYNGESDDDIGFNQMVIYGAYLGDIATPGTTPGTPPNMVPKPNGAIGFEDLMVWTRGWDGDSIGNHDPISDLGPTIGTVPDKIAEPDGYLEVEDILALNTMYSWWTTNNIPKLITDIVPNAKSISVGARQEDDYIRTRAIIEDVTDIMGIHLVFKYNTDQLELMRVEDGGFISKGDAEAITLTREFQQGAEICMSRLSRSDPTVSGSGIVLEAIFEKKTGKVPDIHYEYEIADFEIQLVENGHGKALISGANRLPEANTLFQNQPNPFNSATNISFALQEKSRVLITIHNVLGKNIRTLSNDYYEVGKHTIKWDGRDENGQIVASGEYLLRFQVNDDYQTRRMLYLK